MPGGGVVRVPVDWLSDFAELPVGLPARELADALVRVGLEVERIEASGEALTGPLVVGRVVGFAPEPQKNGKTIRWCQVDVGDAEPRGIVCGAGNFAVGDLVVVALPGAVLPGDFAITARKTYGHVSDGMICSVRELGIGDDHAGILVLAEGSAEPGQPAVTALGLDSTILEIAVTPDRGYCLSIRGVAREAAAAFGVTYRDVADTVQLPVVDGGAYEVHVEDPSGCDRFSARAVAGLDPSAASPDWMQRRLRAAGMRSISLAVDVTNYVMLETGQPLHAFDRDKLSGPIRVRRALAGEKLTTLDGVVRALDPQDLLVTDDSGPVALAGVMGGASTEIGPDTSEVVLEAAHWSPTAISRAVRRHRLPSEAAKRFERNVDRDIAGVALQRCVDLLVEYGGARPVDGYTVIDSATEPTVIKMAADRPSTLGGLPLSRERVVDHLRTVGCAVEDADPLAVRPPSWRPDLIAVADLVEEVIRIEGYDRLPSLLPAPPPGSGLMPRQALRRDVSRALAAAGATEVLSSVFVSPTVHEEFGVAPDDPRRAALRVANPLSEAEPELRTSLLPNLLGTLKRNVGRGLDDVVLYEMGLVYLPRADAALMPRPSVTHPPSAAEIDGMDAALPAQPRHVAAVLAGDLELAGWNGAARAASWADAIELARVVAAATRAELGVAAGANPPWHPGRCAELSLHGQVVGYAGELHPRVIDSLRLPARTCAMELDLDAFEPPSPAPAPVVSSYPPVRLDVAVTV
ncbi:MAG: phenylalanine--tRNA ligase subunit beta, partial [Actinobacteria bacterium]|nr:phenylalanine--tRNA ligase subunit beta [Actinomycetota bacterium]